MPDRFVRFNLICRKVFHRYPAPDRKVIIVSGHHGRYEFAGRGCGTIAR